MGRSEARGGGGAAETMYLVREGDTLFRIALRHGVSVREVSELNGITNPRALMAGDSLRLPPSETAQGASPPSPSINQDFGMRLEHVVRSLRVHFGEVRDKAHIALRGLRPRENVTLGTSGDPALEATSLLVQAPSSKRAAADTGPGLSIADRQCDERTKKIWDEIDVNKDNSLNRQELLDYAERKFFPKHFVDAFIQEADGDMNAELDFEEFKKHLKGKDRALRRAFNVMDADQSGYINVEELEAAFQVLVFEKPGRSGQRSARMRIQPRAIRELMSRLDLNGDGRLDFNEFATFAAMIPSSDLEYLTPYWRTSAMDCGTGNVADYYLGVKPGDQAAGSPWAHLFAGGISGAVAKSVCAPLETIRVNQMVAGPSSSGVFDVASKIYQQAGARGFFRGNLVSSLAAMPSKGICFLTFEWIKRLLKRDSPTISNTDLLLAGAAAGAITEVVIHPMNFVTHRMMVGNYKSAQQCLVQSIRRDGLLSVYTGVWPSVLGIIPFTLMSYGVYDIMEKQIEEATGAPVSLGTKTALGMVASWAGMVAASPLSVVRSRLMTKSMDSAVAGTMQYKGVADAFTRIYTTEGIGAFYKGLGIASLRMLPVGGISRCTYELLRSGFQHADDVLEKERGKAELRSLIQLPQVKQQ